MEFSFMNEETIIKLSIPDTCELMFTLKMCLWWLGAKVLRKTKNLSCPPFLQNEKKKLNQGSMQTKHTNGFQVMEFL